MAKRTVEVEVLSDLKEFMRNMPKASEALDVFGRSADQAGEKTEQTSRATLAQRKAALQLEDALGRAEKAQKRYGDESLRARKSMLRVEEAQERVERALKDTDEAADKAGRAFGKLGKGAKKGTDEAGGILEAFGGKAKAGLASAGAAAAVGFGKAFSDNLAIGESQDKIQASLGLSGSQAKKAGKVVGKLYSEGLGESRGDVAAAAESVIGSIAGLRGASEKDIGAATEHVLNFAKAFDQDVSQAALAAGILMKRGLADDANEAFDLLVASSQKVPPAIRDELLDATEEYSQFFSSLGLTGEEMFAMLVSATDKGRYGIDKVGDSFKEFLTLGSEGGFTTGVTEAFSSLGLNAETMATKLATGGDDAREALDQTVGALLRIKDPAKQSEMAVRLFGAPIEDLSKAEIPDFLRALQGAQTELGNTAGAASDMGDDLNDNSATKVRKFKRGVETAFQDALAGAITAAEDFGNWVSDNWEEIVSPFVDSGEWISEAWSAAFEAVTGVVKDFGATILDVLDTLLGGFTTFLDAAEELPIIGDRFGDIKDEINGARESIRTMSEDLRGVTGKAWSINFKWKPLRDALNAARELKDLEPLDWRPLTETPQTPDGGRGGGRVSRMGFRRFRGGGMVPVAVSSGEAIRTPDGSWAEVPGARVAADNVHTALPAGSEVFTEHGQSLLAAGLSRSEALRSQLPHFVKGGKVKPGKYTATAYGPPWGGIQGNGVTKTGVNLTSGPKRYIVAVDPRMIPLGSRVKAWPNPFDHRGSFLAADTGGAIKGRRLDFYDWRGRKEQNEWGRRQVKVSRVSPGAVSRVDSRIVLGDRFGGSARGAGFEAGLEGATRIRGDLLSEIIAGSIGERDVTGTTERPESRSSSSGRSSGGSSDGSAIGRMISKASSIASKNMPYVYGGGHGKLGKPTNGGFDCSGYVSAILGAGGLISRPMTTDGLKTFGVKGRGDLMAIGVRGSTGRNAHTMIALRPTTKAPVRYFESGSGTGPREKRKFSGKFPIMRHAKGFRAGGIVNSRGDWQPDPNEVGWGLRTGGTVPTLASLIGRVTGAGTTDAGGTTRAFDALSKRLADTMRMSWASLLRLVRRSVDAAAEARDSGDAATARRHDAIANLARGQQGIRLAQPILAFQQAGDTFGRDEQILGLKQQIAGTGGTFAGLGQQAQLVQSLLGTLGARKTSLERGLDRARATGNPEIVEQYEQALADLEVQTLEAQASLADLGRETADLAQAQREAAEAARAQMFQSMESRAGSLLTLAQMTGTMADDVPALIHSTQVAAAQVNEAIRIYGQGSAEADAAFVQMIQFQRDLNEAVQAQRFERVEGAMSDGELELLRAQVGTPDSTVDDRVALDRMLAAAREGAQIARATGDREREMRFLQSIQGLTGQIEALQQSVEQQNKQLADLYKQQRDAARQAERLSQTQYGVLRQGIADMVSGVIGGRNGLGFQAAGVAGQGVRY